MEMKRKLKIVLLLISVFGFIYCSNNDDNNVDDNANLLLGKWYIIQENQDPAEWPLNECEKLGYLEFFSNGNYREIRGEKNDDDTCSTYENQGQWSVTDGKLALDDSTDNFIYYIEEYEIVGNKLTLHRPPLYPPYDEIFIEIYEKR